jgi:hypothetical protein
MVFLNDLVKDAMKHHESRHKSTRPYRARSNGKTESFIPAALGEWAYL